MGFARGFLRMRGEISWTGEGEGEKEEERGVSGVYFRFVVGRGVNWGDGIVMMGRGT